MLRAFRTPHTATYRQLRAPLHLAESIESVPPSTRGWIRYQFASGDLTRGCGTLTGLGDRVRRHNPCLPAVAAPRAELAPFRALGRFTLVSARHPHCRRTKALSSAWWLVVITWCSWRYDSTRFAVMVLRHGRLFCHSCCARRTIFTRQTPEGCATSSLDTSDDAH